MFYIFLSSAWNGSMWKKLIWFIGLVELRSRPPVEVLPVFRMESKVDQNSLVTGYWWRKNLCHKIREVVKPPRIFYGHTQNTFYLMVKGLVNAYLMHFPSLHSWFRCSVRYYLKCSSSHNQRVVQRVKQARKSSEDMHFTEYARFEKVWAG